MPTFEFSAKKQDNSFVSGSIDATDEKSASDILLSRGLYPISITEQPKGLNRDINIEFLNRVKVKDLVVFSRQLAVMAEAALPLVQSLKILVNQTENVKLKKVIRELSAQVDGGSKFSHALSKHPDIFSNFFVSMIRSGETSGRLDEVLNYLADQQERDYDLMSKIKGAMIYPIFIIIGLVVVGFVMMVFVVPKLTSILVESGATLPAPTQILIFVSDFMAKYWWLLLIMFAGLFAGFKSALNTDTGRHVWDKFKIRVPIFGGLSRRIYIVRMTRSLSTLIEGGVPLPDALAITADVVSNKVYADIIRKTKQEVDGGNSLSSVFLTSDDMPVMVSQMIRLGEETGRLDQVLKKLTSFYSREIENMVGNLVSLIEPIIMVVMGIAVGVMVAAIILPMYNLATSF